VHRPGAVPAAAAAALAGHLQTLLAAAAENPERPVGGLPLATAAELRQLEAWNPVAGTYDERCMHEFFETTAARKPDAVALVVGDVRVTYGQLERDANRLARILRRQGVGAGHRVAVLLPRTQRLVVALLAVLKAGAAYVAIDPEYPRDRVRHMLLDSDASLIVTETGLAGLSADLGRPAIDLNAAADLAAESDARVEGTSYASAPAYVIYTSGSTGRPKGVMISHRGVAALIQWSRARLSERDLSGVLASTSVCFDVSVAEIFVTFACGGCAVLVRNVLSLAETPNRDEITLVSTVPSAMSRLLQRQRLPRSLRVLDMGGEPLRADLVGRLFQEPGVEVVNNMYGPTEDTTYSTCFSLRRGDSGPVLIGRPVLGTRAYVVDEGLNPLPVGVPGELYLAGDGLALGYWGDPALTAERFLPDALGRQPGGRMYRTGDLFRILPDGSLDYLGRLDQQVKIRGFRVEPREIEMALLRHDRVGDCVVVAREDTPGERRLVAYYVPTAEPAPTVSELRALLKRTCPGYMIPAAFVKLTALPHTPNHKIDRGRLPAPAGGRPDLRELPVQPRTPTERRLTAIWQRLLGIETIGVHDDFFELGGDSLLATELTAAIGSTFQMRLYFRAIFDTPTIASMAERVDRTHDTGAQPQPSQS
jgi:amino acid adenylation domain-containing protein